MEPFPWINYCKMIKLNQIAFRMRIGTSKSCNQFFSSFVGSNKYKNLINKGTYKIDFGLLTQLTQARINTTD